jgi:hypothetical protein
MLGKICWLCEKLHRLVRDAQRGHFRCSERPASRTASLRVRVSASLFQVEAGRGRDLALELTAAEWRARRRHMRQNRASNPIVAKACLMDARARGPTLGGIGPRRPSARLGQGGEAPGPRDLQVEYLKFFLRRAGGRLQPMRWSRFRHTRVIAMPSDEGPFTEAKRALEPGCESCCFCP